eukprot:15438468-Alexandrium_andersonii.AAC.1
MASLTASPWARTTAGPPHAQARTRSLRPRPPHQRLAPPASPPQSSPTSRSARRWCRAARPRSSRRCR